MLALGDALALVVSRCRQFNRDDFAIPSGWQSRPEAGQGRGSDAPLSECRVADQSQSVREVLVRVSRPGRRTGAMMLIDAAGTLTGLFTDSDLAHMLEHETRQLSGPAH